MQNRLNTQEFVDKLSCLNDYTVFTAIALKTLDVSNKYEVKRWLSYIVPKSKVWTPWEMQELDYDYGNWRIFHLRQNTLDFRNMLNSWFKMDHFQLSDGVFTSIAWANDIWECQRTWSNQYNGYREIPYPAMWYRPTDNHETLIPEPDLIAPNLPYFPSTKEAFAALIDGVDLHNLTNRNLEGFKYGIFVLDDLPFLERVSIHADRCDIVISGSMNDGCEIKIFSDNGTTKVQPVTQSGNYTFQWPCLPNYAVWALTRGHELLDKVVYYREGLFGMNRSVEVNLGTEASIDALVESGEGQDIEFKEHFPKDKNDKEFMETVCAFANSNNGVIIIGVSDRGEIHGIGKSLPEKWEESLSNKIRNTIDPVPSFRIHAQMYHDSWVVIIRVEKGNEVYALNAASTPAIYKRHGSNDFHAKLSELKEMFPNNTLPINNPFFYSF